MDNESGQVQLHILKRAWSGWQRILKRLGTFQANVLLTLTYVVLLPLIAIPFKMLADPLRIKNRHAAFIDTSGVDRASLKSARNQ